MHHPGSTCCHQGTRFMARLDVGFAMRGQCCAGHSVRSVCTLSSCVGAGGVTASDWCGFTRPGQVWLHRDMGLLAKLTQKIGTSLSQQSRLYTHAC
jgi:hypothetical protein